MEKWEVKNCDYSPEDKPFMDSRPFKLWFEYLRISESYKKAQILLFDDSRERKRDVKNGYLPDDFELVLETAKHFGRLDNVTFKCWWHSTGSYLFDRQLIPNRSKPLIKILNTRSFDRSCQEEIHDYMTKELPFNKHGFMLMAVPLDAKKTDILRQLSKEIDRHSIQRISPLNKRIYTLEGKRFHHDAIEAKLRLLWLRATQPELSLWRLGVKAGISKRYGNLDTSVIKLKMNMIDQTTTLASLTSRALTSATLIMENAARGVFPSQAPISNLDMDFSSLRQIMEFQLEADEKLITKIHRKVKKYNADPFNTKLLEEIEYYELTPYLKTIFYKRTEE